MLWCTIKQTMEQFLTANYRKETVARGPRSVHLNGSPWQLFTCHTTTCIPRPPRSACTEEAIEVRQTSASLESDIRNGQSNVTPSQIWAQFTTACTEILPPVTLHYAEFQVCLFVCLIKPSTPIHLSMYVPILSTHPSIIYELIHLSIHTFTYSSIHPCIYMSNHSLPYPSMYLSLDPFIHPCIYPSIHPPTHPPIHPPTYSPPTYPPNHPLTYRPPTYPTTHPSIHLPCRYNPSTSPYTFLV
jgi:hypothetical protein